MLGIELRSFGGKKRWARGCYKTSSSEGKELKKQTLVKIMTLQYLPSKAINSVSSGDS